MKNIATLAAALTAVALTTSAFAQNTATGTDASGAAASGSTGAAATGSTGAGMSTSQPGTAAQPGQPGSTDASMSASTTGQAATQLSNEEKSFIKEAAQGSTAEVHLGQLAQQKAQNPQVKQLAERIVQDHTQAGQQLMQIAQQHNIQPSTEVKGEHKETHDKLQKASGEEFDKQYAKEMVKHHKKDIKKFEEMSRDAKDPQLKSFAQQTLPKLQQHLQMAQAAAGEKGDSASTTGNTGFSPTANYQINQSGTTGQSGAGTTGAGSTSPSGSTTGAGSTSGAGSTGSSTSPGATGSTGSNM